MRKRIRIDSDDNAVDVLKKFTRVLRGFGVRLIDDGLEHDGFMVIQAIDESEVEDELDDWDEDENE
jgi:hypothetical protein